MRYTGDPKSPQLIEKVRQKRDVDGAVPYNWRKYAVYM